MLREELAFLSICSVDSLAIFKDLPSEPGALNEAFCAVRGEKGGGRVRPMG